MANPAPDPVEAARVERMLRELNEKQAMARAQARAEAWDRAMTRAFKGICSRPRRHDALARHEA